ncbi:serine/threonine protein kinase [Mycobacterium sp. MBM]|nr:serine/threonine protein kinase [Mycobacterium sp. MBM]
MTDGQQPMFPLPQSGQGNPGLSYPVIGTPAPTAPLGAPSGGNPGSPQRSTPPPWLLAAAGAVVVVAVAVVAVVATGGSEDDAPSAATKPTVVTDPTVRSDETAAEPVTAPSRPDARRVALNVSVPISQPDCDGSGIVVLSNAVTPGRYDAEIQRALNAFPGASYLRTDHSCPSLRQVSDQGTPIYAVYRPAGRSQSAVCSEVRRTGGDAYGKWLDSTTDPRYILPC